MVITKQFESSSSDAIYTAQLDIATRESSCNCPAWRFVKLGKPRGCKHTKALEAEHTTTNTPVVTAAVTEPAASPLGLCPLKPMLASAMTVTAFDAYCNDAWLLEEKFDGHRVIIRVEHGTVTAWSRPRAGKAAIVRTLPPVVQRAVALLPDGVFDGELVTPGGRSWDVARLDTDKALVLFDVVTLFAVDVTHEPFENRRNMLNIAVEHIYQQWDATTDGAMPIRVPALEPVSEAGVKAIWDRGGEGAILKRRGSRYSPGKRSADWVKVKRHGSAVLTITAFEQGKLGPYAITHLRHADGRETTVKTLDNATMEDIARDPSRYLGADLVISYCELTDTGAFRHGMWDHLAGPGEVL